MQPSPVPPLNHTNPYLDALKRIVFNIAVGLVGDATAFAASRGPHDGLGVLVVLKRLGQLRVLGQGLFLYHACVVEGGEGGDGGCGGLVGPLGRGREQFFVGFSARFVGSVCAVWEGEVSENREQTMSSSASLPS